MTAQHYKYRHGYYYYSVLLLLLLQMMLDYQLQSIILKMNK